MSDREDVRCHQVKLADGSLLPVQNFDLEWRLRYQDQVDRLDALAAATVVHAWSYLLGPRLTTEAAVKKLRALRRVVREAASG